MNDILGNQILAVLVSLSDSMRDMREQLEQLQQEVRERPVTPPTAAPAVSEADVALSVVEFPGAIIADLHQQRAVGSVVGFLPRL